MPDILNGNYRRTLKLLWNLIKEYHIRGEVGFQYSTSNGLINWIKAVIPPERGSKVTDLTSSWWNGAAMNTLAQRLDTSLPISQVSTTANSYSYHQV